MIRLTAFWNFVALGHQSSQMTTMQKRDFSSVVPGVKLFHFEPAVSDDDLLAGDTRHHLINLLYTNTLPFQLIKITTQTNQSVNLIFLKSQHSFRHTSLAKH